MISILHPEIIQHIQQFDAGYIPLKNAKTGKWFFAIKATKEMILTAKTNNEFKVYLLADYEDENYTLGLMTAFFDDHDEPLTLTSPVFEDDELMLNVCSTFNQPEFEVYFFDELDREIMGATVTNENNKLYGFNLKQSKFYNSSRDNIADIIQRLQIRFAIRDSHDDEKSFTIKLGDRLYPDDMLIMDLREEYYGFNEDKDSIAMSTLERDQNPGNMQERDIAQLFRRVFNKSNIYLNPYRMDTDEELTDILIVCDNEILFVQAKDSPNTFNSLNRKIERKRKTIKGHIDKATTQLRGAISYAQNNQSLSIKTATNTLSILKLDKQLIGMIVVKELFDNEYAECSKPVLELMSDLKFPAILTDYTQLHLLTKNVQNSDHFFTFLVDIVQVALTKSEYPKIMSSSQPYPPQAT